MRFFGIGLLVLLLGLFGGCTAALPEVDGAIAGLIEDSGIPLGDVAGILADPSLLPFGPDEGSIA